MECSDKLVLVGTTDNKWVSYYSCKNNHKYQIVHGDAMAGSADEIKKVNKIPLRLDKENG